SFFTGTGIVAVAEDVTNIGTSSSLCFPAGLLIGSFSFFLVVSTLHSPSLVDSSASFTSSLLLGACRGRQGTGFGGMCRPLEATADHEDGSFGAGVAGNLNLSDCASETPDSEATDRAGVIAVLAPDLGDKAG